MFLLGKKLWNLQSFTQLFHCIALAGLLAPPSLRGERRRAMEVNAKGADETAGAVYVGSMITNEKK